MFGPSSQVFSSRIVMRDGRSRGYGYVEFASMDSVDEAIKKTGSKIKDRLIRVDYAQNADSMDSNYS